MKHLRANVNHSSAECFHHFSDEKRMFEWISGQVGQKITSYKECEEWTSKQKWSYIEVLEFFDVKNYYFNRREYINAIERCEKAIEKARRRTDNRRDTMCAKFTENYDAACTWADLHPEVWHGEV